MRESSVFALLFSPLILLNKQIRGKFHPIKPPRSHVMSAHDHSYKHLFSHPRMVTDLMRGFVHEDWVEQLDFSTLEKLNASYITEDLRHRADDIVWRVRMTGGQRDWVYVYLLMEFQSTPDRFMAVRMMSYLALLYLDLIKSGQVPKRKSLPAVFPIVIYNGERPWRASVKVEDLIEDTPAALAAYRPRMRYFLLDEGRVPEDDLSDAGNAAAGLINLERATGLEEIQLVVKRLDNALKLPENQSLRRGLSVWLRWKALKRFAPAEEQLPEMDDLEEVDNMLEKRVERWKKELKREALEEGRLEGRQQGRQEGRQEGRQQGRQEGESSLLRRQLVRRFGPLPAWVDARIEDANTSELEAWAFRILEADSLEAVFETH